MPKYMSAANHTTCVRFGRLSRVELVVGKACMAAPSSDEVLFEIRILGNSAQVSAIHVPTNTEVKVICPAALPTTFMQKAALRRLLWVLNRSKKP